MPKDDQIIFHAFEYKKIPCSDAPAFFSPLMVNFPCCYLIAVLQRSWKALRKLCVLDVILSGQQTILQFCA